MENVSFKLKLTIVKNLDSIFEIIPINVAGLAGFEPARDGVKVRCLTAWL